MISEHHMVVLTASLPEQKLQAGDFGTVVHLYPNREAYEIEFSMVQGGASFAIVTIPASQVRPLSGRDLFHVRELAA
jgi:hypothetical protein